MEIKELRVGNWIDTKDFHLPSYKGNYKMESDWFKYSGMFEPIPLTEEWLLKFGFKKIDASIHKTYLFDYGAFYFKVILMNDDKSYHLILSNSDFSEDTGNVGLGIYKYLHQLQNLIFALTNKEFL